MRKQPEKTAQTRQNIIDAFWIIAHKRGLRNTTISEISKAANINRGTFYVYFSDMEDIIQQAEQQIMDDFCSRLSTVIIHTDFSDIQMITKKVIELVGKYDETLFLLIGKDGDPHFLDRIRHKAAGIFRTILSPDTDLPYQDFIIAYIISAFAGLLQFWHESGKTIPLPDLTNVAHQLAFNGILGIKKTGAE